MLLFCYKKNKIKERELAERYTAGANIRCLRFENIVARKKEDLLNNVI